VILATALFCFVPAWNEFLLGHVLINDEARRTLTPGIMVFKGPHVTDWGRLWLPPSLQSSLSPSSSSIWRRIVEQLSTGAVKG
jgi:hypothetical protein